MDGWRIDCPCGPQTADGVYPCPNDAQAGSIFERAFRAGAAEHKPACGLRFDLAQNVPPADVLLIPRGDRPSPRQA